MSDRPKEPIVRDELGDFDRARTLRLEADRKLPMNERLARVHELCLQVGAIKGVASR